MSGVSSARLFATLEATWPAMRKSETGGFIIREGCGGGKRVSAASLTNAENYSIAEAEQAMMRLEQPKLFMMREGQSALDDALAEKGYRVVDPTSIYQCEIKKLLLPTDRHAAYSVPFPILAKQAEIWTEGGVGPERLDIMNRADVPKATMLARRGTAPVATCFVACSEDIAMLHALEVVPKARRGGVGRGMMIAAAHWASDQGAKHFALAVTRANHPARSLYQSLGMRETTGYHYRMLGNGSVA